MRWHIFNPRAWKQEKLEKQALVQETVTAPHLALGRRGEELAAEFLSSSGFLLVAANFKLPVGRSLRGQLVHAEIDCIAYEGRTLCFIEVKTRASTWFAPPEANVDLRKQRQITRAARTYRRLFGLAHEPFRYDVVTVVIPHADEATAPQIELLRNFWTEEKFRKRRWRETQHALA